ncbi:transcriptional regulator with XRE-family HTH domain [Luteibacter jiangsuensis]|uniref:Transcriptional regulator with XRE-family HTH domain n=1 Tax=Luteibacter jiangsuensis TaxID=637577 RepID=A0ABT9ST17_9GAMM|nr:helix-turn-helix transcriptional regulator [Luteibacter jiangsuensis]MDQ0008129.1 transcriptional regulator with XRE-family HTH domain [Luteibacter jiangsuensis]
MSAPLAKDNALGEFLRDRRAKLDAAALGFPLVRRRTPGLRREEVAQRANVSATWYTWLEQGRGGAPSADVLDRIARALMLTDVEREHLFLLGLGRPPEVRYQAVGDVTPRLQRVLDAFDLSPAIVRTATWDVIAWNRAAAAVLTDYGELMAADRNILRLIFSHSRVRERQLDWESVARFVVASFRADVARAGASKEIESFVAELSNQSAEFDAMWRNHDVSNHGGGTKIFRRADGGLLTMEYSAFTVDGRPDLSMIVYNPATPEDAASIRALLAVSPD